MDGGRQTPEGSNEAKRVVGVDTGGDAGIGGICVLRGGGIKVLENAHRLSDLQSLPVFFTVSSSLQQSERVSAEISVDIE